MRRMPVALSTPHTHLSSSGGACCGSLHPSMAGGMHHLSWRVLERRASSLWIMRRAGSSSSQTVPPSLRTSESAPNASSLAGAAPPPSGAEGPGATGPEAAPPPCCTWSQPQQSARAGGPSGALAGACSCEMNGHRLPRAFAKGKKEHCH